MKQGQGRGERHDESCYAPLAVVCAGLVAGVLVDRYQALALGVWVACGVGGWCGWSWMWLDRRPTTALCCLLVSLLALGGASHHAAWRLFSVDDIALRTPAQPTPVCCEGVLLGAPEPRRARIQTPLNPVPRRAPLTFLLRVTRLREGASWSRACGECNVEVAQGPLALHAGEQVRLWGEIAAPAPPQNPGQVNFALAQRRLRRLRRLHVADGEGIIRTTIAPRLAVRWWPAHLRERGCQLLRRYLPAPSADLASAMLLGARSSLSPDRSHQFLLTGTAHLLAISGLHIGILTGALWLSGRSGLLPATWTQTLVIHFVFVYALVTAAQPPIVRAGLLIISLALARLVGRQVDAVNTLGAAGIIVVWINPASLFRLGTQFSFLAVTALMLASATSRAARQEQSPLERLIQRTRPWPNRLAHAGLRMIWQPLASTSWIWLISAPLVAYRFHLVSPVALLVNPLLVIPVAIALLSGFGVLLTGSWLPTLAGLLGGICHHALWWCEKVVEFAADVPAGYAWVPAPAWSWVLIFYVGYAGWIVGLRRRCSLLVAGLLISIWAGIATVEIASRRAVSPESGLVATFVAVGHGSSVVLQWPDGRVWLYDAGRLGNPDLAVRRIAGVLWQRGITHVDCLLLSHADIDHYNAVPGLLERFGVGQICVTPRMFSEPSPALEHLQESIRHHRILVSETSRGDHSSWGDMTRVHVLHPSRTAVGGSDNANSLVLWIECQGRTLVLPGDLESPGSAEVLCRPVPGCEVLMAPHHGSIRSDPAAFLEWASPQLVVISSGDGLGMLAARRAYEESGSRVFHTERDGAIRVKLGPERIRVESWSNDRWVLETAD